MTIKSFALCDLREGYEWALSFRGRWSVISFRTTKTAATNRS